MSERAGQPTSYSYSPGWRLFTRIILHPLLRLLMRNRWAGKENIPRPGGIILAPNHLSYADWGTIALFSDSYAHRYPVFMIKSPVFGVKFVGALLTKVGQLPVYRGRGDAGLVLKAAEQALRAGACVIVYPEGTASRDPDLWPMVGKTGAARLALTTGVPVIPIAHWGAQEILPYGTRSRTCSRARRCGWRPGRRWTCPPTPASGSALRRCRPRPPTSWPTSPPCWPRSGRRPRPPHHGISKRGGRVALDRTGGGSPAAPAGSPAGKPGGEAGSQDEAAASGGS